MRVVYVIGLPGAGKTTMVERALDILAMKGVVIPGAVPYTDYEGWLWHIGKPRDEFGGTDTLSMSIQPKAIRWVREASCQVVLAEGDRLANEGFFSACPNLTLIYLDTPLSLAGQRMAARARRLGREPQAAAWWKGRVTKVDNIVSRRRCVRYDGTWSPEDLGVELVSELIRSNSSTDLDGATE